ncbi:4,5-dihydroxyphthalate decarboxylase [Cupriavidus sp. USMAA2-4]|uniref:4,5-dihydroxyphthalate decarboxylase n=1 Tax=Cupriavidus malaysiensis TaxID=367825 RepID=A0ABN4TSE1_9BURK|nr:MULTISPECIES: PhnD/SsuA/transferrin family substrate-binding protein [Cupriavidus]AOY95399.1 4,5-dihydroxyphthalate decarboxylase [Cupriavidus sp. USMAA2-4]AOZ01680.1 4,5-dihydroxyphthalate decarboxylase [Cupriavidus sp. USMAHM13]AOZ08570.1 4,5-dihydroxyphthalate decarboxylase [Cupriavidus malaysiensis]
MSRLRLTMACWDYDRVAALKSGEVAIDGVDLNFLAQPVEETFFRMLRHHEFDIAEMSLSSYVVSLARGDSPFIAVPVFPSRFFRHSCIFVSAASGIETPADLAGRRIGVPEYQMTAPVWIRGILADEYGVAPDAMEYWTGGEEQPGREEKLRLELPERFRLRAIGAEQTLASMLADGEIDALFTARTPSTFHTRPHHVRRLFPDYQAVEQDYYRRAGIFPIMHTVVIRREVYLANRWLAQSLYKALQLAQRKAYEDLRQTAALKTMLPWLPAHVEQAESVMGRDWWPYGFAANRHVLETFLRYHHEQGLSPAGLRPEDLFAPEALESFLI